MKTYVDDIEASRKGIANTFASFYGDFFDTSIEHAMWDSQYQDHRRGTGGRAVGTPCRHFDSKATGFPNFEAEIRGVVW